MSEREQYRRFGAYVMKRIEGGWSHPDAGRIVRCKRNERGSSFTHWRFVGRDDWGMFPTVRDALKWFAKETGDE